MVWIRAFNDRGMDLFRSFLNQYQEGGVSPDVARDLASSRDLSFVVQPHVGFDIPAAATKSSLAAHVCAAFERSEFRDLPLRATAQDRGMWTWLAAVTFHLINPRGVRNGRPYLREYVYYILSENTLRYGRHRVAGPARIHWLFRDNPLNARLFLAGELDQVSEFENRLALTMRWLSKRELVRVADLLYFDPETRRQKTGAVSDASQPGVLRRFVRVIDQLDHTYDLHSMSTDQILNLLPPEFDRWKTPTFT